MTTANRELSRFYVKQGLTGKHLRAALKHDRRAVRRNSVRYGPRAGKPLWSCFGWMSSPEGGNYWMARVGF